METTVNIPDEVLEGIDDLLTFYHEHQVEGGITDDEQEYFDRYLAVREWYSTLPQTPQPDSGELLGCPFCGGKASIDAAYEAKKCHYIEPDEYAWYAEAKCACGVEFVVEGDSEEDAKAKATAAWNQRIQPPPQTPRGEWTPVEDVLLLLSSPPEPLDINTGAVVGVYLRILDDGAAISVLDEALEESAVIFLPSEYRLCRRLKARP